MRRTKYTRKKRIMRDRTNQGEGGQSQRRKNTQGQEVKYQTRGDVSNKVKTEN